jgi:hypothetical protein
MESAADLAKRHGLQKYLDSLPELNIDLDLCCCGMQLGRRQVVTPLRTIASKRQFLANSLPVAPAKNNIVV